MRSSCESIAKNGLGAIRRLDDFLLLKLFLDAPSLSHARGKCHRRYGKHCRPRLHSEQRLILTLTNKWPKAAHCSPHGYYGQNKNPVAVSR